MSQHVAHRRSDEIHELRAEIERLRQDNERLRELFALKWDATQSAETEGMKAENERLRAALRSLCCPGDCRKTIRVCYEAGNCGCTDGLLAYGTKTWPRRT
jgi:hypothetical protein